jgi:hypothetical protein
MIDFGRNIFIDSSGMSMDFGKPGIKEHGNFKRADYSPKLVNMMHQELQDFDRYQLELRFGKIEHEMYGAPEKAIVQVDVPFTTNKIKVTVSLINKTPTRAPESLWVSFNPIVSDQYMMDKIGHLVSPADIAMNGSVHQHGIDTGVFNGNLAITSQDVALVSFGEPTPFPSPLNVQVDLSKGFHYNWYNNIWGTNYIMWYPFDSVDKDSTFSFEISV